MSLVGRDDELDQIVRAHRSTDIDLVVLVGAAGVGKSHLAMAALESIARIGAPVKRAVCTAPLQQVPYASIAGIAALAATDGADASTLQLAAAARSALITTPRTALSVDDVNFLDEPSAGLLAQLIGNDRLFTVATLRQGARLPESLRSLAQTDRALWLDLQALDRQRARTLVESILGGQVDGSAEHAIWTVSQGNPLYVRELVAASAGAGTLRSTRGTFSLTGPLARGQRLHDLVGSRLGSLDSDENELAQLLALCQPVRLAVLPVHLLGAAERLDRSGHITVEATDDDRDDRVRLSHPIYAEVIAEGIGRLVRQRLLREHLARLGDTMAGTIDDDMSRVVLELDAGVTPDPERLMRAARLARQAPDFQLVRRLAGAAIAVDPGGLEAVLLLSDALYELGEHEASRDAHVRGLALADDDFMVMLFATSAHRVYLWGLDSPDEGVRMLRSALERVTSPVLRDAIVSAEMNVLAFSDRAVEALEIDARIVDESYLVEEIAAVSRTVSLTCIGRATDALWVSRDAEARQVLLRDPRAVLHPVVHQICRSFAHAELGQFDEAISNAGQAHAQFVSIQMPLNEAWSAINMARAHMFAGSLATALRWANEAAAAADRGNFRAGARLALMVSAICSAQLGHGTDEFLQQVRDVPDTSGFFGVETPIAEAWCLQVLGRPEEAREVLAAGALAVAARGLVSSEVFLVHECARAGLAEQFADRAVQLTELTDSPFAHARLRHVVALARGSADDLAAVAADLEAQGAVLTAAEAAASAGHRYATEADQRRAAAMSAMSHRLAERCEGAATPGLQTFDEPSPLTDREREIARLAARGLTSRAIAEELFVSTRTVENHLQRVYIKLGVSGRAELADLIGN
jgi:DNA-binding NarL/FixJ family response regulator